VPTTTSNSQRISHEQTLALWQEYRDTGDPALRDRLVLTFAPLVKYIVFKKVREVPAWCEVEDFISCGLEALIRSIDRYDPSKGATLEQFAWTRIHGAVLDELRRQDWAPRSVRRLEREIEGARSHFTSLHGRRPSDEELADAVGLTTEELRSHQDDLILSDVGSLNAVVAGEEHTAVERVDTLESSDAETDPELVAARQQSKERFRRAFSMLPRREREVAVLLYVKNLTLREIGDVLGVSESRVCQIHSQMRRQLKSMLADDALLFTQVA
jgi:RNA polymerase sigma factor for flagellar operon FliA